MVATPKEPAVRHPSVDDLADYREGGLDPDSASFVQEHLVSCEECRNLLLDFADYPDVAPPQGMREISDSDVEAAFQASWTKLAEHETAESPIAVPGRLSAAAASIGTSRLWLPIAAVLSLACLGLLFHIVTLRRTLSELSAPQVNTAMVDLFPEDSPLRSGAEPARLAVADNQPFLTLILHLDNLADDSEQQEYTLGVFGSDGREMWHRPGIDAADSVRLTFPRSSLPPDEYRFRIEEADRQEAAAKEYKLEVVWP